MTNIKILSVVGARPNFIKIAPFIKAIKNHNLSGNNSLLDHILVHTGQHYDDQMSHKFFVDLDIPQADINLGVGSGSHAVQVGKTMIAFEKVLNEIKPDWVVVVGDVNATLACSITAKKNCIKVCHIEAGLRSGDIYMPEEINRIVTDRLSDLLLTPDRIAGLNLTSEGIPDNKIVFTGNIMIDTLDSNLKKAKSIKLETILNLNIIEKSTTSKKYNQFFDFVFQKDLKNLHEKFMVITLHRPSNVDNQSTFSSIVNFLCSDPIIKVPIIWPIHPRAYNNLNKFGLFQKVKESRRIFLLQPVGYNEMLKLNMNTEIFLTDSGGLQEECTVLGTPCLTIRENTERPITLTVNGGTSVLVGNKIENIRKAFTTSINKIRNPFRPELWDGHSANRCLEAILQYSDKI